MIFGPRNRVEAARIADEELGRLADMRIEEIRELPRRRDVVGQDGAAYSLVVDVRREGDLWRVIVAVDDGGFGIIVPLMRSELRPI